MVSCVSVCTLYGYMLGVNDIWYRRKTLLVTLLKDKVAIRSALHTATSCEVHAFLGDA